MVTKRNLKSKESRVLFLMAFPCIVFIFVFAYSPLRGWLYALYNYKPGINLFDCRFVGLTNFMTMFSNQVLRDQVLQVLLNTFVMAALGILCSPLAPMFAIFLNEMRSGTYKRLVQTITTVPHFISWVIVYSLVFFMLSVNTGFVNNLLLKLGWIDHPLNLLVSRDNVWLTMKSYDIWKGLGWSAIIYLAAIAGIDTEQYEAATVDGANRLQKIWHITVPGIVPTYFVLLIISFGNFLNVGMDQFLVFQNAMNKQYVQVLDLYVYNQGIAGGSISYATAVGILKSGVAILLFSFANWLSKRVRGYSIF